MDCSTVPETSVPSGTVKFTVLYRTDQAAVVTVSCCVPGSQALLENLENSRLVSQIWKIRGRVKKKLNVLENKLCQKCCKTQQLEKLCSGPEKFRFNGWRCCQWTAVSCQIPRCPMHPGKLRFQVDEDTLEIWSSRWHDPRKVLLKHIFLKNVAWKLVDEENGHHAVCFSLLVVVVHSYSMSEWINQFTFHQNLSINHSPNPSFSVL